MSLAYIQTTTDASSLSLAGSSVLSALQWAGHTIQVLGQSACNAVLLGGAKCVAAAQTIFSGASMYANMGWQVAKYCGARSWEIAKIGGAYGAEKAAALFSTIVQGVGEGLFALKCLASKAAAAGMSALGQLRAFAVGASAALGMKVSGGLQAASTLAAANPAAAGAVTLALAGTAVYFASRSFIS